MRELSTLLSTLGGTIRLYSGLSLSTPLWKLLKLFSSDCIKSNKYKIKVNAKSCILNVVFSDYQILTMCAFIIIFF